VFEVAGAALMTVAGWMGGTLVYRNQIGVDHRYADAGKWREERLPAAYAPGDLVDVASEGDLQVGQMKLFRIGDLRIALARTESGYRAFSDRCTHKGGPLSDGVLICGTVQCPWHGSQFDADTGEVKAGPAGEPIETYPVRTLGGRVLLELPVSSAPAIRRSR
jgi:nitrite reductase/ring-hydroxylating ferredoxin subunit